MSTTTDHRELEGVSIPPAGTYELDPGHTSVEFVARHMLTKLRGRFTEFKGTIEVAEDPLASSATVEIASASIQTNLEARDNHLKSGDFLLVEEHPILTFASTRLRHLGDGRFELDGDLTIKEITNPVTLKGRFLGWGPDPYGNTIFTAEAETEIDREDWEMTWNVAVETGGFLVGKKVKLEIAVEAKKVD
jgi:polyisoprenoid-binding protein YceI